MYCCHGKFGTLPIPLFLICVKANFSYLGLVNIAHIQIYKFLNFVFHMESDRLHLDCHSNENLKPSISFSLALEEQIWIILTLYYC